VTGPTPILVASKKLYGFQYRKSGNAGMTTIFQILVAEFYYQHLIIKDFRIFNQYLLENDSVA
jgi:hypothetical protein